MWKVRAAILTVTLLGVVFVASAQTWRQTSAPLNFWMSVASSADGKRIVAASFGPVYISTNSGNTWASAGVPQADWKSVASSADGSRLVIVGKDIYGNPGWVYTSTNYGVNWISNNVPQTNWQAVACSSNGLKLIAGAYSPGQNCNYCSTDGGTNWTLNYTSGVNDWQAISCSSDASKLVAINYGGFIYTSTDLGTNWTQRSAPIQDWFSVASSADGAKCYAASISVGANAGEIYASTNSGTNWVWLTGAPATNWSTIASSADGIRLVAAAGGWSRAYFGPIYLSADSGSTWAMTDAPITNWSSVACSADGTKLVAASLFSGIYVAQLYPPLTIKPLSKAVAISWTASQGGFILQCNTNLNTTNWQAVTNSVSFNPVTLANQVTVAFSATNQFYRLALP